MKRTLLFLSALVMVVAGLHAQNYYSGSITLDSGTKLDGRVGVDQSAKTVFFKDDNTTFGFDQVQSLVMRNREYMPVQANGQTYLAHALTSGKATLYHLGSLDYLVVVEGGQSQTFTTRDNPTKARGVLAVLYGDCTAVRQQLDNLAEYNERNLIRVTDNYNNCDYGAYTPTEREVQKAAKFNTDYVRFYLGAGVGLNSIKFFDTGSSETLVNPRFNAGVAVSPAFNNSLHGSLFFYFDGAVNMASEKSFSNAPNPTTLKVTSWQFTLGAEYQFNQNGKIKPYLGAGFGVAADRFQGNYNGDGFNITGGNVYFSPKVGVLYALNNGDHLGLNVNFIPRYENDLSFPKNREVIPFIVNSQYTNIGLLYFF